MPIQHVPFSSDPNMKMLVPDRVAHLLDCAHWASSEREASRRATVGTVQRTIVDVSQNITRHPWSATGVIPTLTTSADFFFLGQRRFMHPKERVRLLGFPHTLATEGLTDVDLKNLTGEAMGLPAVGLCMLVLHLTLHYPEYRNT